MTNDHTGAISSWNYQYLTSVHGTTSEATSRRISSKDIGHLGVAAELVLDDPSVMQVLDIVDGVDEVVHDDGVGGDLFPPGVAICPCGTARRMCGIWSP
jgi:hypothetical protein